MELHQFMCPEPAVAGNLRLRRDPAAFRRYPSELAVVCDFEAGTVSRWTSDRRGYTTDPLSAARHPAGYAHKRANRTVDLIAQLDGRARFFLSNMRDSSPYDPEVYLGHDANVLQHHRRVGARSTVLWRLPNYWEPSPALGGVFRQPVTETRAFRDKLPKIFWRGRLHGQHWIHRNEQTLLRRDWHAATTEAAIAALEHRYSRAVAVLFARRNPDLADCAFVTGPDEPPLPAAHPGAGFYAPETAPSDQLAYRYLLCPVGIDICTQLYWVLQTNSLAFKEESPYECIPDFYLKPWVHYVPVAPGLGDLREKFEFCESHPRIVEEIIARAQEAHATILNPEAWREAEDIVLDRLGLAA